MEKELADAIWEDVKRLDDVNFQLGDVLDVKASIILVIITLLSALPSTILSREGIPGIIRLLQVIAGIAMALAVVFATIALWPRDFEICPKPESWATYIEELEEEHKSQADAAALILQKFREARMRVALKRINLNKAIAEKKARFNDRAFYATAASICVEIVSLGRWLMFCQPR